MRVMLVHNYYQRPGGEDVVFESEANLLETFGHEVSRYTEHNGSIVATGRLKLAAETLWSTRSYKKIRNLIRETKPQVVHFHNTFPLVSPSAYYAVDRENLPVVQTLHNYRMHCLNALFFRDGAVCEDCLEKPFALPGIKHSCYRGSRSASSVVAALNSGHHLVGTWSEKVDRYIALTEFSRAKLVQGGLDGTKIVVKPNFVYPDPGHGSGNGEYALFVGRLSQEKGVGTLLEAWRSLGDRLKLKIAGDGPMREDVLRVSEAVPGIEYLGYKTSTEVYDLIGNAAFVIVPSECYETFGLVAIEAFAKGTPVISSSGNCTTELVKDGVTGTIFESKNAGHLADRVRYMISDNGAVAKRMRRAARKEYETKYTADTNHEMLLDIYQRAIDSRQRN